MFKLTSFCDFGQILFLGIICHHLSLLLITDDILKGRVQCFLMQVVLNTCFVLNSKIVGADLSYHFREKRTLIPKKDVIEPKAKMLSYSNS